MAKAVLKPSPERSRVMRAVKSRDTAPEKRVRRFLHNRGLRFRLCTDDLPGKPDIVLRSRRTVVFVHGCFWHGHDCKRGARMPNTNRAYWTDKIARNAARDDCNCVTLTELGWRVVTVWECATRDDASLARALRPVLRSPCKGTLCAGTG